MLIDRTNTVTSCSTAATNTFTNQSKTPREISAEEIICHMGIHTVMNIIAVFVLLLPTETSSGSVWMLLCCSFSDSGVQNDSYVECGEQCKRREFLFTVFCSQILYCKVGSLSLLIFMNTNVSKAQRFLDEKISNESLFNKQHQSSTS